MNKLPQVLSQLVHRSLFYDQVTACVVSTSCKCSQQSQLNKRSSKNSGKDAR